MTLNQKHYTINEKNCIFAADFILTKILSLYGNNC